MKLIYRGVAYDYDPPQVPVVDGVEVGKYRGATLHFHKLVKALTQPAYDLKYRGVSYHAGSTA